MESYFQIDLSPKVVKGVKSLRLNYSLVYAPVDGSPAEPDWTLFDEQYYDIPPANWQAFAGMK